jgi:translation initiation factor 1
MPDDGVIRVARERRRGGTMTLVFGLRADELDEHAKTLKRRCGSGGTVKNGVLEVQGDHRESIVAYFAALGRRALRAGG